MSMIASKTAASRLAAVSYSNAGGGAVSELLARASERKIVRPADGKSHATFERVTIDGGRYFLKCSSPETDWVMRATGDRIHRPYVIWQAGVMDGLPDCIDHTVKAMEVSGVADQAELRILMRDVSPSVVPGGDTLVAEVQHRRFVDLAELSVRFWDWENAPDGLTPPEASWLESIGDVVFDCRRRGSPRSDATRRRTSLSDGRGRAHANRNEVRQERRRPCCLSGRGSGTN
jgi:hypothetical protein